MRILCPYDNEARYIPLEVCKWHQEEKDPECVRVKCKRAVVKKEAKPEEGVLF